MWGPLVPKFSLRCIASNKDARVFSSAQTPVRTAYAGGVPMGGDLPPLGEAKAPSFAVWAV
ncbi:DUF3604 domain-containing protein, partial [Rhizobium ruizarguesonis]